MNLAPNKTRRGRELSLSQPPHPGSRSRSDPPPQWEGWDRATGSKIEQARKLRKSMTRYEVKLWLRLRELKVQGFRFRRQMPIQSHIVDFACLTTKLIVEVDGMQHGFEINLETDLQRDQALKQIGFTVLRFTNEEIWQNIDGAVEQIYRAGKPKP